MGVMENQIEDLRTRMRLLQKDRRSNIDLLNMSQKNNTQEISQIREENKELRVRLNSLTQTGGNGDGGQGEEIDHLKKEVLSMRSEYDSLKSLGSKHRGQLQKLKDEIKTIELESKKPNLSDNPLTRQIRLLENRLDKAMIKYNEAQSIRSTYEQIVKRLKEERVGFDNQLGGLERTLASKVKDYEELLFLSGDANHAREVSQLELAKVKGAYEEERERREKELRERHQVVQLRKQMYERSLRREKKREEIGRQLEGEAGVEEAGGDADATAMKVSSGKGAENDDGADKSANNKISIFENAFRKIKEATGVSDVNEVIQKIIGQEGTTENLMMLTKENQAKLQALQDQAAEMKKKVEEMKYSNSGGGHRRKLIDDQEEQFLTSHNRLDRHKAKYSRLSTTLISVKAGIKHLQDKVENIREDVGGNKTDIEDATVVEVLRESEETLVALYSRCRSQQMEEAAILGDASSRANSSLQGDGSSLGPGSLTKQQTIRGSDNIATLAESEVNENRPYNQRITLPNAGEDTFEKFEEDHLGDLDEEELTRDKVKKASSQILTAQDRKIKAEKRKKKGVAGDR